MDHPHGHLRPVDTAATDGRQRASRLERQLLTKLLDACGNPAIAVRLPTGERIAPPSGTPPVATLHLRDRMALLRMVLNPERLTGDDYSAGRIDIEGDFVACLEQIVAGLDRLPTQSLHARLMRWINRPRANTLAGSRENIHHHYDIGNDFYRLWLDTARMQYTCAYFPRPDLALEDAQIAKLDHVARKLRIGTGDIVYEAGCGWGGLARHLAKHCGVGKVRAFNISEEQVRFAREQARREGLDGRVEYVLDDYRNMDGRCDAFVSVGMLEHVGIDHYPELGAVIRRVLRPGGLGLIHSVGRNAPTPMNAWLERRIFPGACPASLGQMMRIFEDSRLSVLDVENLRLHYALTLGHWLARFERHVDTIRDMFDERFVRMWRLYLGGTQASFRVGSLQLFQVVFAHATDNTVPMTREHLYRP